MASRCRHLPNPPTSGGYCADCARWECLACIPLHQRGVVLATIRGEMEGGEVEVEVPRCVLARTDLCWEVGHGPVEGDPEFAVAVEVDDDGSEIDRRVYRQSGDVSSLASEWVDEAAGWAVERERRAIRASRELAYLEASPRERLAMRRRERDDSLEHAADSALR